jgi:hypothetical protein
MDAKNIEILSFYVSPKFRLFYYLKIFLPFHFVIKFKVFYLQIPYGILLKMLVLYNEPVSTKQKIDLAALCVWVSQNVAFKELTHWIFRKKKKSYVKLNLYKLSLNPNVSIATIVNNSNGQKVIRALKRKRILCRL